VRVRAVGVRVSRGEFVSLRSGDRRTSAHENDPLLASKASPPAPQARRVVGSRPCNNSGYNTNDLHKELGLNRLEKKCVIQVLYDVDERLPRTDTPSRRRWGTHPASQKTRDVGDLKIAQALSQRSACSYSVAINIASGWEDQAPSGRTEAFR
jgi:hypothetical protein